MKESAIQMKIKKELEKAGWLVIKLIQTTMNGINDLMALKDGKVVFIEVKRPGEQPRPLQQYRMKQLREQGFEAFPAWSVDDIKHLLNN